LIQLVQADPKTLQKSEKQKRGGLAMPDTDQDQSDKKRQNCSNRFQASRWTFAINVINNGS
jgi:hypothetical protein